MEGHPAKLLLLLDSPAHQQATGWTLCSVPSSGCSSSVFPADFCLWLQQSTGLASHAEPYPLTSDAVTLGAPRRPLSIHNGGAFISSFPRQPRCRTMFLVSTSPTSSAVPQNLTVQFRYAIWVHRPRKEVREFLVSPRFGPIPWSSVFV